MATISVPFKSSLPPSRDRFETLAHKKALRAPALDEQHFISKREAWWPHPVWTTPARSIREKEDDAERVGVGAASRARKTKETTKKKVSFVQGARLDPDGNAANLLNDLDSTSSLVRPVKKEPTDHSALPSATAPQIALQQTSVKSEPRDDDEMMMMAPAPRPPPPRVPPPPPLLPMPMPMPMDEDEDDDDELVRTKGRGRSVR
ncbi:hypothetical protein A4X09_0g7685 [Tilletia walkeri]|uniref:Uncharacterized protein n=1 Tax=Tilletia walkeri TaxID=117179 RepID=A0A8X7N0H4_9BASI|nr:hypothetical protein A4X09_0g7685 [Tilletia walkeri]